MKIRLFIIIAVSYLLIACAPSIPDVPGYDYVGTVTELTSRSVEGTSMLLNNEDELQVPYKVSVGSHVYINKYGQVRILKPDGD